MNDSTHFIVAVDGGGSKVSAVAISKHDALSRWPTELADCHISITVEGTGSANEFAWPMASRNIYAAVDALCAKVQCDISDLDLLLLALSGAGRSVDRARVLQWATTHSHLSRVFACEVVGDIDPIVDFQSNPERTQPSIAAIVGTGSIVASRQPGKPLIRAGGWGPILGDEGSGWAIARDALCSLCTWLDNFSSNPQPDELIRLLIEDLDQGNSKAVSNNGEREILCQAIINLANDRKQAAKLAPKILQLAVSKSESPAAQIVRRQIDLLAAQIRTVYTQAGFASSPWTLAFSGGLICNHIQYQSQLLHACETESLLPDRVLRIDPLIAALQMATRLIRKKHS